MSDSIFHIVDDIRSTAAWRHGKAVEFPDDSRNLKAADELERLADEIDQLGNSDVARRIEALDAVLDKNRLWDAWPTEWQSEELRAIGFRTSYETGTKFLEAYCDMLGENLRRWLDDDLAEQVEDDPAVKVAREAYEAAQSKAHDELRKAKMRKLL